MIANHRKKLLGLFLAVAILLAFFLTYQNKIISLVRRESAPVINEVKGEEKGVAYYDASHVTDHLTLSPSNIAWFTNYYRVQNHVAPMHMSESLNKSAHAKSSDMFVYDYFEHTRPNQNNEKGFEEFIDEQHYQFIRVGENLARGDFKTSRDVVDAWMASDAHRRNILGPSYTDIGVSIDTGILEGITTTLFVQHFGLPEKVCPIVSDTIKATIEKLRLQIDSMAGDIGVQETNLKTMATDDPAYNNRLDEYNAMVSAYNGLVSQLKSLVGAYNDQVAKFDACVRSKGE